MNADQEPQLRGWLAARDPGDAPARLRAAVSGVPFATSGSIFPALDALMGRLLGPSALASRLALLAIVLTIAAATTGAALLLRSGLLPPPGLIAYVAPLGSQGATGISLVAADGTGGRRVTAAASNIFEHSPRWSADGRTLLFARTTDLDPMTACGGVGSIVLYDLATATERIVASDLRPLQQVEWLPSGDRVAFVQPPPGCSDAAALGVVDLASGRVTTSLLQGAPAELPRNGVAWELRWVAGSPSASEIDLFSGDVPSQDGKLKADCGGVLRDPTHRLVIADQQSGAEVDLGPGQAGSWSPDGSAIAFIVPTNGAAPVLGVYHDQLAIAVVGSWQVRVLDGIETTQTGAPELRWTADGGSIYWVDGQGGHLVDVASGRSTELPAELDGSTDLDWQPVAPD